ncbi:MAG: hypothetical protein JO145_06015 [Acidobacteriaceae bacterium]|nr:hypothetical protein [Acidobacteriaceae bacterium]MBV9763689.1 hypothetical protein [Acidobacteriaceae bacterium]
MKQLLCLAVSVVAIAPLCAAAPCGTGSLASYIALGAGGCTIGGNTLFDFQVVSGTAGATPIAPGSITMTPFGSTYDPGLMGQTHMTASAGQQLEAIFTYRISGTYFSGDSITLGGSSETADGGVTDVQNYCAGGTFGPDGVSGCTGSTTGSLLTDDGVQNQDSASLPFKSFLNVTDDFTLDGGTSGTASGGTFADRFSSVPEPLSFLLTGMGIALAAGFKFRSAAAGLFRR